MYGDETVDVSTVRRCVRRYKEAEGQTRLADETRSGLGDKALLFPGLVKRWTKTVEMDGDYIEK